MFDDYGMEMGMGNIQGVQKASDGWKEIRTGDGHTSEPRTGGVQMAQPVNGIQMGQTVGGGWNNTRGNGGMINVC